MHHLRFSLIFVLYALTHAFLIWSQIEAHVLDLASETKAAQVEASELNEPAKAEPLTMAERIALDMEVNPFKVLGDLLYAVSRVTSTPRNTPPAAPQMGLSTAAPIESPEEGPTAFSASELDYLLEQTKGELQTMFESISRFVGGISREDEVLLADEAQKKESELLQREAATTQDAADKSLQSSAGLRQFSQESNGHYVGVSKGSGSTDDTESAPGVRGRSLTAINIQTSKNRPPMAKQLRSAVELRAKPEQSRGLLQPLMEGFAEDIRRLHNLHSNAGDFGKQMFTVLNLKHKLFRQFLDGLSDFTSVMTGVPFPEVELHPHWRRLGRKSDAKSENFHRNLQETEKLAGESEMGSPSMRGALPNRQFDITGQGSGHPSNYLSLEDQYWASLPSMNGRVAGSRWPNVAGNQWVPRRVPLYHW